MKTQPTDQEKIFAYHVLEKGLSSLVALAVKGSALSLLLLRFHPRPWELLHAVGAAKKRGGGKGLISRICKKVLQLNNKRTNDPVKKVSKGLKQIFSSKINKRPISALTVQHQGQILPNSSYMRYLKQSNSKIFITRKKKCVTMYGDEC